MSDIGSDFYDDLLKRYDDLMNQTLNKDLLIKNIAQTRKYTKLIGDSIKRWQRIECNKIFFGCHNV